MMRTYVCVYDICSYLCVCFFMYVLMHFNECMYVFVFLCMSSMYVSSLCIVCGVCNIRTGCSVCTFLNVCAYVMYVCMYVCLHVCMYVCTYVVVYV